MLPEIDLGPLTLKTFGLFLAAGFLVAGAVIARRLRELGRPTDWAYEIIFAALVGGVIGARIDFLLENWDSASEDLLGSLVSGSGLVWLGGVVGGAIAVMLWGRWRGCLDARLFDLVAVPLAIGNAIGRIGCQLSGDGDYGTASGLPWAMSYPDGTVPTTEEVHPTPVYETLAMGAIALLLWRWRDRFAPGVLFGLYLVLAGSERLLVEFVRRNDEVAAGLTLAQLLSLAMIAAGVAVVLVRGRRARPAAAR